MFAGEFLLQALYPDKAKEINRIILRHHIVQLLCIAAVFVVALVFHL